jgi:hypothetical protein
MGCAGDPDRDLTAGRPARGRRILGGRTANTTGVQGGE